MYRVILVDRLCGGALRAWRIDGAERIPGYPGCATASSRDKSKLLSARDVVPMTEPVAQVQAEGEACQDVAAAHNSPTYVARMELEYTENMVSMIHDPVREIHAHFDMVK